MCIKGKEEEIKGKLRLRTVRKNGHVGGSKLSCLGEQHCAGSALKQGHSIAVLPGMASCDQDVGRNSVSCSRCGLEGLGYKVKPNEKVYAEAPGN